MKKVKPVLVVLIIICVFLLPSLIKVKIVCKSQTGPCPPTFNERLKVLDNQSLPKAKKQIVKILQSEPTVTEFYLQLKLPNTLQINIIIKKPVFSILNKSVGKYAQIDADGTFLSYADSTNLPILVKDNFDKNVIQKIDEADYNALKFIRGVNQMYQIKTGTISNDTLLVDLPQGIRVIFPLRNLDTDVILGSLRLVYTKVTTDYLGVYKEIDLRYKNPILR